MGSVKGVLGRVLAFTRVVRNGAHVNDVKVTLGGEHNLTFDHFSAPGDDSHPLPDDYVIGDPSAQTGRYSAKGYVDPKNVPKANAGEKRIYARNSAGVEIVEIWLKADGTATMVNAQGSVTLSAAGAITLQNAVGSLTLSALGAILGQNANGAFQLNAAGQFSANGVTIDGSGNMVVPTSLMLAGKQIAGHHHPQGVDAHGDAQPDTGANA